ncbi:MSCRAMM family protein, partial [Peptacetobacter sp.]|uniref:MSCRAMM family protein n=1 Tax=Peptacetobacter sp. TaxID=2991975 RepID=UPI002628B9FE
MRKSLNYNGGNTNFVIENAEFNIFDNPEGKDPLYFREIRKGVYKYSKGPKDKKIDGQKITTNLVTDKNGEIRLLLPKEYLPNGEENKKLYYKEVKAPEGVIIDGSIKEIVIDKDSNHKWTDIEIQNEYDIKDKDNDVKIEIQKVDDDNRPLRGAEFTLYKYPGDSEEQKIMQRYTNEDGIAVFEKDEKNFPQGFVGGEVYTIKETSAPEGYVLDKVIVDIEIDKNAFHYDPNKGPNGTITAPIMTVRAKNSKNKGILTLKKVDKTNHSKALAGAEFKLYKKVEIQPRENIGNVKEDNPNTNPNSWHPYGYGVGIGRYLTNKIGVLEIDDLSLGEYYYEETKAPVGYKILPGSSGTFKVEKQNESHLHEINITVENEEIQGNKGNVELEKVNSKGEYLEGVEFKLYKREFYNGIEYPIEYGNNPYITNELGKITIDNIPIGNYYLEETKTLDGYVLPNKEDRKFYFDVTENTKDKIKFKVENKTPEEVIPPGPVDPDPDKPVNPDKPDKPDKPVDPDKPDKPDKPVDPNKPDKPDKPEDPNKPDKPDKPEDPNKPNKPDNPNDSGNPSKPNKPSIISKIPKTGDSAQLLATGAVFV